MWNNDNETGIPRDDLNRRERRRRERASSLPTKDKRCFANAKKRRRVARKFARAQKQAERKRAA